MNKFIFLFLVLVSFLDAALVFEDKESSYSLEDVMSDSTLFKEDTKLGKGFSKSTFWLKIELKFQEEEKDYYIYFLQQNLAEVTAYAKYDSKIDIQKNGFKIPKSEKKIQFNSTVFKYHLDKDISPLYVYVKIKSDHSIHLSYEISQDDLLHSPYHKTHDLHIFVLASIFILAMYNLVLFLFSKDTVYLYYALNLMGSLLAALSLVNSFGLFFGFWEYNLQLGSFGEGLIVIFSLLFVKNLFQKDISQKHIFFIDIFIYLCIFRTFLGLFFPAQILIVSGLTIVPFTIALVLFTIFRAIQNNNPIAKVTFIAYVSLSVGALLTQLTFFGFIETTDYMFAYIYGNIVEAIILSIMLAYRLKVLQSEKRLLQKSEQSLQREKEKLQYFMEEIGENIVVYRHDIGGKLEYLSKNFDNVTGLHYKDVLGKTFEEILDWEEESLEGAYSSIENMVEKTIKYNNNLMQFTHPLTKEIVTLDMRSHAVFDSNGNAIAIEGLAEDVSAKILVDEQLRTLSMDLEKKNQELKEKVDKLSVYQEELQSQNEQLHETSETLEDERAVFSALFHNNPSMVVIIDENNKIVDFNKKAQSVFLSRHSGNAGIFSQYLADDMMKSFLEFRNQLVIEGYATGEFILRAKSLKSIFVTVEGSLISKDNQHYQLVLQDISELKELQNTLEQKVQDRTEELSFALDNMTAAQEIGKIGSFVYSYTTGLVTYFSKTMYDITHLDQNVQEISLERFLEILHPEDREKLAEHVAWCLQTKSDRFDLQYRIVVDGEVKYVHDSGLIEYNEDQSPKHYRGNLQDITHQVLSGEKNKKQEAMLIHQDRLVQLGSMVSMIAHQWVQPLSALSAWRSRLIGLITTKPESLDEIQTIDLKMGAIEKKLTKIIDDFKNFYKDSKGESYFDLKEAIEETLALMEHTFALKSIEIDLDLQEGIHTYGNKNELEQVVLALLSNALDELLESLDQENKKVSLRSYMRERSIVVEISDNGRGVPQELQDQIFDPYFTTKGELNGTGLGLYMCNMIMNKSYKGKIMCKSNDKGTTFSLDFPIQDERKDDNND